MDTLAGHGTGGKHNVLNAILRCLLVSNLTTENVGFWYRRGNVVDRKVLSARW